MADKEGLLESPEFQNYTSVQLAFEETAKELHEYVDKKLKAIHEDVYTRCSKYQPCHQHCSETWKDTHRFNPCRNSHVKCCKHNDMADKEGLLESPEFQNYTSVQLAFEETARELHEYVDKKLKAIHEDVYTRCSKYQPCHQHCSETWKDTHSFDTKGSIGNRPFCIKTEENNINVTNRENSWCDACKEWKKNISQYIRPRGRRVYWDKMRSWEWPQNNRKLGRVFANQCWEEEKLNDLPTYLEIIKSCKEFKLPSIVLDQVQEIRQARNKYIGHNPSLRISENDKNRVFDMIIRFVSSAEISREINSSLLLQVLHCIQMGKPFQRCPEDVSQVKKNEVKTHETKSFENGKHQLQGITFNLKTQKNDIVIVRKEVRGRKRKVALASMFAIIFTFLTFANMFTRTGKDSLEGCLTEDFSYPLRPDIYLSHYIKEHTKIVGREWLLHNISDTIFDKQFESTGVLLVAEMGFGKSALISHIVCAESKEPGGELRSRLLAYHVCRFDALNTKRAANFIRRLAGMISNSIPQFGSALETEYGVLNYLNSTKCNYDPVGCMDQSIVYTLSKVESSIDTRKTWIIAIDALDECEDADTNKNEIISVLERTAHRFPKWIKFLCTSRNISTIVRRLGDFRRMEITPNDDRNKRDIYDFVSKYVNDNQSIFQKLSSAFTLDKKSDIVDRLCEMSSGNILYIRQALEYLKSTNVLSVENIPDTLDKIYQLNFERIYGKTEERFHWARKVLEILCASIEPLKKETIFDMLRFDSLNMSKNAFSKEMQTLMHFVRSDERLSFTHISMYHWLTDVKREGMTYFIEKEVGHNLIARYLFHLVKESNNDSDENIINLALHVSESKRQDLISYFNSLPRRFFNSKNESGSLLHKLAKSLNSYSATELCLPFFKDVDILNADNVTAAFIAAGRGHVKTLRALLDAGAKITFRISLPTLFATVDDASLIIKTRTFWGYGLLDIAAQHGHVDTTLLLLNRNRSMANISNEMNVKPHHLACEFGHVKVLDIFLNVSPEFADQRCLYNAASSGHVQIIERLLILGVKDLCLPCNGGFYWLKENESRMQSTFFNIDSLGKYNLDTDLWKNLSEKLSKRKPFDDWQSISCETALHVSSRLGFLDTVRLLIAHAQDAITCRDRAGRTPFLTAVIHNRTDIVELLYPLTNASDKCLEWNLTQEEIMHLNGVEINKLLEGKCSNGSSVVHLISQYGLTNLAQKSLFRDMDWEEVDNEGRRPIHHAACHAGLDMLVYLYRMKVEFFSHTKNGSTAFHIAALCRPYNLHVMYLLNSEKMPQVFDNLNRSILQYMYMHPLSMDSNQALNSISERVFLMERLFSVEDIMHIDLTGANILHYIMKYGYFNAIPFLYNTYPNKFFQLILASDRLQNRPLDEAFYNLPYDNRIIRIPYNCSMEKVISHTCDGVDVNDYVMYLSPIELSIFFFVITVSPKIEYHRYFKRYVHEAIKRSNVYVTLMFWIYFNARSTLGIDGFNPLTTFTSIGNNPIMANLFLWDGCDCLKCGMPIEKSPLHQISLNMNNSFWFVDTKKVHGMVKDLSTEYIEQCADNEGFNVLQRAIEGGNYELAKYYFDRGLSLTKNSESVLQYVMLGAMAKFPLSTFITKPYELQFFNRTKHQLFRKFQSSQVRADYDKTTLLVLRHMQKSRGLMYDGICQNKKSTLSLVHLIAANGLLKSLDYIANKWGKKALLCQNADLLSPIYLAYVFNQSHVIRYLEEQNITLIYPKPKLELYLSYILLFDMNNFHQRKLLCLRSILRCVKMNYSPQNYFVLVRVSSCFKRVICSDLLLESVNKFKNTEKIMARFVRIILQTLHCMDNIKKLLANNHCIMIGHCTLEHPELRSLINTISVMMKNIISLAFENEIVNQQSFVYTMKWLANRWSNISKSINLTNYHHLETISSLIDPSLGKKVLYLRTLTHIGRYNELRTISEMLKNRLNITKKIFSFELPKLRVDAFKPLNDLFRSKKHVN